MSEQLHAVYSRAIDTVVFAFWAELFHRRRVALDTPETFWRRRPFDDLQFRPTRNGDMSSRTVDRIVTDLFAEDPDIDAASARQHDGAATQLSQYLPEDARESIYRRINANGRIMEWTVLRALDSASVAHHEDVWRSQKQRETDALIDALGDVPTLAHFRDTASEHYLDRDQPLRALPALLRQAHGQWTAAEVRSSERAPTDRPSWWRSPATGSSGARLNEARRAAGLLVLACAVRQVNGATPDEAAALEHGLREAQGILRLGDDHQLALRTAAAAVRKERGMSELTGASPLFDAYLDARRLTQETLTPAETDPLVVAVCRRAQPVRAEARLSL